MVDDPAYGEPLPPTWALDQAAKRYGYRDWLNVPTLFRTPENRRVIVDARVLSGVRAASAIEGESAGPQDDAHE